MRSKQAAVAVILVGPPELPARRDDVFAAQVAEEARKREVVAQRREFGRVHQRHDLVRKPELQ